MESLSFSEFAKILAPYCRYGANQDDFVKTLTDKIMEGRPARTTKEGGRKNPMRNRDPRDLQNYFNGSRPIPQRDAEIILSSVGKYRFEEYLRQQCSEDALSSLKADLYRRLKRETVDDTCDIVELCADLFVEILQALASEKATE